MNSKHKILIVDDEEDLCEILQFNLEGENFFTDIAYSAEEALGKDLKSFDLILLDVMMEQMSGFKFAEKIRKDLQLSIPIIFITAKNTESDLLTGFSLGGDDYITKPFSVKEVIVRVKALLKRAQIQNAKVDEVLELDGMKLNFKTRKFQLDNKNVQLTRKEFEILALLIKNKGKILSRNEIISTVWDDSTVVLNRTIDVHIARVRKKIEQYGKYIKNKTGFGYILEK